MRSRLRVLEPMGIRNSSFAPDVHGDAGAGAGLHVDVSRDAVRGPHLRARDGAGRQHVLDRARSRALHQRAVQPRLGRERVRPQGRDRRGDVGAAVRAGWRTHRVRPRLRHLDLEGQRRIGHGGAIYGFATELQALPESRLGVVVATTLDCANPVMTHIADEALRAMLAGAREAAVAGPGALDRRSIGSGGTLVGRVCRRGDRRLELNVRGTRLVADLGELRDRA